MERKLLTTEELADYLHCSRRYIYIINDQLPKVKVGKRYMYDSADINSWLDARKITNNPKKEKQ